MWPMWLWFALPALAAAFAVCVWPAARLPGRKYFSIAAICLSVTAIGVWLGSQSPKAEIMEVTPSDKAPTTEDAKRLPASRREGGFVGAATCRECHAKQHATWHHSYHRFMTQVVSPQSVLADFSDVTLASRGRTFRLWKEQDKYWANMVDPDWDEAQQNSDDPMDNPPRVSREIIMSTGSHHFQTYWINGTKGNELWQVPWVYHLAEKRWMPAEDAFVAPPDAPRRLTKWNDNCIQCHAVAGQPGLDTESQSFNSRVADLGIACESCHGPGQEHIAFQKTRSRNPDSPQAEQPDPIVNPSHLPHERSSQVCGQCHSYFSFADDQFWRTGFTYRPGDNLLDTRLVHAYEHPYVQSRPDLKSGYWPDGTNRLAGREFSAMDDSACFKNGELSCLSCHSLHGYEDRDDQLAPGMRENEACLQCHGDFADRIESHTHHAKNSSGSKCYNCHMPHTSFGLLKAIRSHRIDSPTVRMTSEFGRPNACNLCHVDETLGWTSQRLQEWYGHEPAELPADDQRLSLTLRMLLGGDAAQRAVVAWNLGQPDAVRHSSQWPPPFLALTLLDNYAAVRFTAYQSLRQYPGFQDFQYDFLGSDDARANAMRRAVEQWRGQLSIAPTWPSDQFLLRPDGAMQIEHVQRLMGARDNRPIFLPE